MAVVERIVHRIDDEPKASKVSAVCNNSPCFNIANNNKIWFVINNKILPTYIPYFSVFDPKRKSPQKARNSTTHVVDDGQLLRKGSSSSIVQPEVYDVRKVYIPYSFKFLILFVSILMNFVILSALRPYKNITIKIFIFWV